MEKLSSSVLLETARKNIEHISVADAKFKLNDQNYAFVDVREKHEYEAGHIPSAIHAARGLLEFYLDPESDFYIKDLASAKTLIFVCGSGGRAALSAKLAKDFGYTVCCMTGGMRAWSEAGN